MVDATRCSLALALLLPLMMPPPAAAQLAPTGTLRAAFLETNPIQGRIDPATGALSGPVADLVRELARRLGVPHTLVPVPRAPAAIEAITTGRADIAFIAFEAARAEQVDFSEPYLLMASAYLVRDDSRITRSADVDRAGVIVGAVAAQAPTVWIQANLKNARIETVSAMPSHDTLVKMLVNGDVEAFAANRPRLEEAARSSNRVRLLPDNFTVAGQNIVVQKGSAAQIAELNRFLSDIRTSGFMRASLDRAGLNSVDVPGR
jgi:polar amino acid transport system substrate-binding protein